MKGIDYTKWNEKFIFVESVIDFVAIFSALLLIELHESLLAFLTKKWLNA